MPQLPIEEWYYEVPVVTRVYLTLVAAVTIACELDLVLPFQLHFSHDLIFKSGQYWRLITSFLYFGGLSFDFLFHMFFLVRYMRMLEEGSFRGRTADFFWMLLLGAIAIIIVTPLVSPRSSTLRFLSSPLTFMLLYIWSRRNPHLRMNFLGVFTFTAPYLPWVLLGFSILLHGVWPSGDLVGTVVGHCYYFLDDVWPEQQQQRWRTAGLAAPPAERWVRAPTWVVALFDRAASGGGGATAELTEAQQAALADAVGGNIVDGGGVRGEVANE
ncbi:Der1-like family-domain-containing protein [Zopfochytrium polystomum]|nr:Der1-like family-domain-containing protein [Zopfochytrium polystomum]